MPNPPNLLGEFRLILEIERKTDQLGLGGALLGAVGEALPEVDEAEFEGLAGESNRGR
jgi:hypothetical protein